MIEKIQSALKKCGISNWIINFSTRESYEIFMVRREEDQRRAKTVTTATVTVFHDTEKDGAPLRGSAEAVLSPDMTEKEMQEKLSRAFRSALYAANPFFELPDAVRSVQEEEEFDLRQAAETMLDALYAPDTDSTAFINSAEIFAEKSRRETLTSKGTHVSYGTHEVNGEFVVQCLLPRDVEMYFPFRYGSADTNAMTEASSAALKTVRDRANAEKAPEAGTYSVLLTEDRVHTLLSALVDRANAAMVYPGYSKYKPGYALQSENCEGEKLNIRLFSREPFSPDGIPMPERTLIENGTVTALHGATRFCRYLGIEPVGSYGGIRCFGGTLPMEEMKQGRVLMPVAFSDFQCDSSSGFYAGEIRLAYLFENGSVTLLTGGSISGSLTQKQDLLCFSVERSSTADWEGPKAVLIPGVSVAGE